MKYKFKQAFYIAATQESKPTPANAVPKKYYYIKRNTSNRIMYFGTNGKWVDDISLAIQYACEGAAIKTANMLKEWCKDSISIFSTTIVATQ